MFTKYSNGCNAINALKCISLEVQAPLELNLYVMAVYSSNVVQSSIYIYIYIYSVPDKYLKNERYSSLGKLQSFLLMQNDAALRMKMTWNIRQYSCNLFTAMTSISHRHWKKGKSIKHAV